MKNLKPELHSTRWGMGVTAGLLALTMACVSACAGPNPPEGSSISVAGNLTRKGSEPVTWWALTDDQGQVWRVKSPTTDQNTVLEKSQNKRIKLDGVVQERYLNQNQIKLVTISNP